MKDCRNGEDELYCEDYKCPGFYRCRNSLICLHPSHLCDGMKQCPEHEDEYTCKTPCPPGCTCQGLEFTCREKFQPDEYKHLRYLNAAWSTMAAKSVSSFKSLIFLSLAHCKITEVQDVIFDFPDLLFLDLSYNNIQFIHKTFFDRLRTIKELHLAWNPSIDLLAAFNQSLPHTLSFLDLSGNNINKSTLTKFLQQSNKNVKMLNISYSSFSSLISFRKLPNLEKLDITNNAISFFPVDVYEGLDFLQEIYTDNSKLCCSQLLSHGLKQCFADADEISSCENLLRSNLYRISLWIFAVTSMVGNFSSLFSR